MSFYNEEVDLKKNSQDNDFNDNKLTNIASITVDRDPTSDDEVSSKKYIVDELDKNAILRFNQTLQNYLQISVGNDIYKLTEYDKIQLTDIRTMRAGNTSGYLLPCWITICNNKNDNG